MDRRTTLILVAVFAALLLYVLLVQRPADEAAANATPTPGVQAAPTGAVWAGVTADQIIGVTVEDRAGGRQVAFGRNTPQESWAVTAPEAGPADQLQAATDAAALINVQFSNVLTPTGDLAAFGVLSPTFTVEIKLADGKLLKAAIGDKTITGNEYYVQREGETSVLLVSSFSLEPVLKLVDEPPFLKPTETPTAIVSEGTPPPPTATP
ncbi:MAG: DUF4340 domain-containing protein [Anaerolineales bacterium]